MPIARDRCPETPFIFVTGSMGEELAIDSLRSGATDYVLKTRISNLVPVVELCPAPWTDPNVVERTAGFGRAQPADRRGRAEQRRGPPPRPHGRPRVAPGPCATIGPTRGRRR